MRKNLYVMKEETILTVRLIKEKITTIAKS